MMRTPEKCCKKKNVPEEVTPLEPRYIVDYERCEDLRQLKETVEILNRYQYQLISVTQDSNDVFTVFFRRCIIG